MIKITSTLQNYPSPPYFNQAINNPVKYSQALEILYCF